MKTWVFDIEKTVAAAGYIAKKLGGSPSIFVLMKTMYGAERDALLSWHRPITGDSFCSMKSGVVLSRTYDLIKGEVLGTNSDMKTWARYFSPRDGNCIHLISEPDLDFLSEREREALDKAHSKIQSLITQKGKIADVLHAEWPEWKDPRTSGKGSIPIDLTDILSQAEDDEEEIERIALEIESVQSAKAALQVN